MTKPRPTSSRRVPILLLPPSEGKAEGGDPRRARWDPERGAFGAALGDRRCSVVEALARARGGDEKLLGVRGEHLVRAQSANSSLIGAPTTPAWRRYTGVVWDHLDPATLPPADMKRILVVSGLLGVVRGDDPVPDYRLKMGASPAGIGKLSSWWRDDVSAVINRAGRRHVVVDLLPNEHRAAWVPAGIEGWSVQLVDPSGKPGGHFAKAAKGALARAILTDGLAALDNWRDPRFDTHLTPLAP